MRRVDTKKRVGESWYTAGARHTTTKHLFSASQGSGESEKSEKSEKETKKKTKKEKRRKKTESGNEKTATSDGTGNGVCWSDYERVANTTTGAKGSCRPK